jgi:hypoxanthine-guanine phosphoribosyltransferase
LARSRNAKAKALHGRRIVVLEDLAEHGLNGCTAAKVRQWVAQREVQNVEAGDSCRHEGIT